MGMTLDEKCYLYGSCKCQTAGCVVRPDNGCPVYRYFKDLIVKDYENRLKTDMVAMLTGIQLKIEEKSYYDTTIIGNYEDEVRIYLVELDDVNDIIQEKINTLEVEDGNDKKTVND